MQNKIKNEKLKGLLQKYGLVAVSVIPLVLIFGILAYTLIGFPKGRESTAPTEQESTVSYETEPATEAMSETAASLALQKDAYPAIQTLMERYFEAKMNCDVEALSQIVNPMEGYTVEGLENDLGIPESEAFRRVEDYRNITCYTKPGLLKDTYVVWVYYETKYVNVETAAPCMFKAYVCTDDMGVYIYNGTIEGEISNYIDEASQDEDVVALVGSVNQQLSEACGNDEELRKIYDILWGSAETVPETAAE